MMRYPLAVLLLTPWLLWGSSFKDLQKQVTEHTLSNGLKVIFLENHQAPVVSMFTYVNVGSVNEKPGITGIAHIFEHMAFKGTNVIGTKDAEKEREAMQKVDEAFLAWKKEHAKGGLADKKKLETLWKAFEQAQEEAKKYVASGEFTELVEREGCTGLNAFTSWDETGYVYNFPSNKLEFWAYMESERFLHPRLREFYTEKNVVMEERRMRTDSSPVGRLIEEFVATAYIAHPYQNPVVGWMSDLKTITRKEAQEWLDTYYHAGNMVVAIVGDVYPDQAISVIEKYFGRLPKKPEPEPVETVEPPQRGERRVILEDPSQPFVILGYHKGDIRSPDRAVFDAITDVMGRGRSSRLYKRLVKKDKIALTAGAFTGLPGEKYPGLFIFYGLPMKGHTNEEVEKAILEEIEKLKTKPITDEELKRIKTRAKGDFIRELKSNIGMAVQLASTEVLLGDWRELFKWVDKIEKVTKEDIMRVAKATFTKNNRTVAWLVTKKEGGEQ